MPFMCERSQQGREGQALKRIYSNQVSLALCPYCNCKLKLKQPTQLHCGHDCGSGMGHPLSICVHQLILSSCSSPGIDQSQYSPCLFIKTTYSEVSFHKKTLNALKQLSCNLTYISSSGTCSSLNSKYFPPLSGPYTSVSLPAARTQVCVCVCEWKANTLYTLNTLFVKPLSRNW